MSLLLVPLECVHCQAPVELALYPVLLQKRDELVRQRKAEEAARKQEEQTRRAAERDRRTTERHRSQVERAAARIAEEAGARRAELELAVVADQRKREKRRQQLLREKTLRANDKLGWFGPFVLFLGFLSLATLTTFVSVYGFQHSTTIMHEISAVLILMLAFAIFAAGVIYVTLSVYARALATKIDSVRDAISEMSVTTLNEARHRQGAFPVELEDVHNVSADNDVCVYPASEVSADTGALSPGHRKR